MFTLPLTPLAYKPRTYEETKLKPYDDYDLQMYWDLCKALLDRSSHLKTRSVISKNEDADRLHHEYNEFIRKESDLLSEGVYVEIAPFAKRTQQYVLRVAAVFAFFEGKDEIDYITMKNAILIVKYSLDQWLLYLTQNKKSLDTILLEWMRAKVQSGTTQFKVSTLNQYGPEQIRTCEIRKLAVKILLEKNLIKYTDDKEKFVELVGSTK
ncbi:DUF3987 domain-containing protein [Acinetobacter towneri]|uniref:DUF3987 domain-containing protein n=1 Tax=Acinetobacter towneri TaxID=202956 RepID=UPI00298C1163|nr:DUF3987 domain-containing protein [Acinetobacter towneri]MCA4780578.1 DUF3987 domain-containing protein [Acinetobacter towneri]MCA4785906.1 DUF3987 domain-containing protein [Acinetobacter towneri]MCA4786608.1 DUF3987 domain-containing protein [Acinetobacter towneri]MCA4797043.1 DUF3987 domain-containing protein [Acinetobacter towneri]MCA4802139.1 DUF3987 domain-containing protein [Acinetobacter towneri]